MPLNDEGIRNIEAAIGYVFTDKKLLVRAFTHTSAENAPEKNYQTLEFLGDGIVDFLVAEKLMQVYAHAPEGTLTKMRASIVSEEPLANAIDRLRISKYFVLGVGETRSKIYEHASLKCDLFESITAAIYLDGGLTAARNFVLTALDAEISAATVASNNDDAKSKLNEYAAKYGKTVSYDLIGHTGPDHKPEFVFSVSLNGEILGKGSGTTKQDAQQQAAAVALKSL